MARLAFKSVSIKTKIAFATDSVESFLNIARLTFVSNQVVSKWTNKFSFSFAPFLINSTFFALIVDHVISRSGASAAKFILAPEWIYWASSDSNTHWVLQNVTFITNAWGYCIKSLRWWIFWTNDLCTTIGCFIPSETIIAIAESFFLVLWWIGGTLLAYFVDRNWFWWTNAFSILKDFIPSAGKSANSIKIDATCITCALFSIPGWI